MLHVKRFVIRLWVHEAEDGLVPEAVVEANTAIEAAALALRDFEAMGRPTSPNGYLQCEPNASTPLRVKDVLAWRATAVGADLLSRRRPTVVIGC